MKTFLLSLYNYKKLLYNVIIHVKEDFVMKRILAILLCTMMLLPQFMSIYSVQAVSMYADTASNKETVSTRAGTTYTGDVILAFNPSTSTTNKKVTGTSSSMDSALKSSDSSLAKKDGVKSESNAEPYPVYLSKPVTEKEQKALSEQMKKGSVGTKVTYSVGTLKTWTLSNLATNADYTLQFKCIAIGEYCNIWTPTSSSYSPITAAQAQLGLSEFDANYPKMREAFGEYYNPDGSGKVNILYYDIQDEYTQNGSGAFTAGYFYPKDMLSSSNNSAILHIDTYPLIPSKGFEGSYSTMTHELQHMINYSVAGKQMDTWLNECMSMAAEELIYYNSSVPNRISQWNDASYPNFHLGRSFFNWDNTLGSYAIQCLFGQYLRAQTGGYTVFSQILDNYASGMTASSSVVNALTGTALGGFSISNLILRFRVALLLKQPTGIFGFMGDTRFDEVKKLTVPPSYNATIYGCGGVLIQTTSGSYTVPTGASSGMVYVGVSLDGEITSMSTNIITTHTVTFKDGLTDETIETQTVERAKDAVLPEPPVHEGHVFSCWDSDGKHIIADTTITAIYDANVFTVTFIDGVTGAVIGTQTVAGGHDASLPSSPSHPGYTFLGWSSDGRNITGSTEITAQYAPISVTGIRLDKSTAKIYDKQLTTVQLSASVIPSDALNRTITWSSSDTSVAAVYASGLVTAVAPGTAVITATAQDGGFTASCTVTVEKWDFKIYESFENGLGSGWVCLDEDGDGHNWFVSDNTYSKVYDGGNCITSSSYDNDTGTPLTPDNWLVSPAFFATPDTVLSWVDIGQDPNYCDENYKVYVLPENYTDLSEAQLIWSGTSTQSYRTLSVSLSDYAGARIKVAFRHCDVTDMYYLNLDLITVRGSETMPDCVVTFVDGLTGQVIETQTVSYGSDAQMPSAPAHVGYTFSGWDDNGKKITSDRTITANYRLNTYIVTFVELNGRMFWTEEVAHGEDVEFPTAIPDFEGYTFVGWDNDGKNITSDITIRALYEKIKYTVTFVDGYTDEVISQATVEYGSDAVFPAAPEHYGYEFTGWDDLGFCIMEDRVITACYERIMPKIIAEPEDAVVEMGETAYAFVTAEGEGLTYQWYGRDVGQPDFWKSSICTDTYFVKLVKGKSSRQVYCVITDAYGDSVTTRTVTLTAKAPDGYSFGITEQPESAYVDPGETVYVNLTAEGEGLKYTWYICDAGADAFTLSSIKTATYATVMNDVRNGRRLYCVVTDKNGYTEQSVTVTIGYNYPEGYAAPVITVQPEDVYVDVNETAVTSFTAEGTELTYQWYILNPGETEWIMSSLRSNTYYVTMIPSKSGRQIKCVVTDKFGAQAETDVVTLNMIIPDDYAAPVITVQPEDVCVEVGETAITYIEADGTDLTYQWYLKDPGSSEWIKSSLTSEIYSVRMIPSKDGRQIKCVVTDKYGAQTETDIATLTMTAPDGYVVPTIVTQPMDVTVNEGEVAITYFTAEGYELTYQWYLKEAGSNVWTRSSIKTDTYYVTMVPAKNGRQLKCVITDKYGLTAETNVVTLRMNPPEGYTGPVIISQPEDCTVPYGEQATSTVVAEGYGLTYQWYGKDPGGNVFMSSLRGSTYYVAMVPEKSGREIYCVITDAFGFSITTRTATLRMADNLNQTV